MARTISGSYSSGITLSNPSDNPVTVTGTISLATAGNGLQAASAWSAPLDDPSGAHAGDNNNGLVQRAVRHSKNAEAANA
jgi:hypothetical protein